MTLTVAMDPTDQWTAFADAGRLAHQLSLTVEFKFNDLHCVVFSDGRGLEWYGTEIAADWKKFGLAWRRCERGRSQFEDYEAWLKRKEKEVAAVR